ncbi:MAG: helix-turn-helix domain-containing protein [Polaromonas sp.]|uniref:IclR family transcriptional regulator n=1 Tax=Polaromonas sp. TaxID=1869339 RepID=UPI00272FCFDD|nr:helix-turn-helix domain-containing protein [Polaromonas sp.]MDP2451375.1 helix-turn-helix domain-containing protein [Polaromonas sp.]MDP3827553.1 helix-turn-helix domain-containing protein [Polaromonas sp.]
MNVKQAANVLDLLEFFAKHRQPATLAEVSKLLEWPRSSTFNLLGTLAARGFLYEPRARGGYYPSPLWFSLLQQIESAEPIPEQLRELLHALVQRTGETAVLAASSSAFAVFLDVVESPHAIRYTASPGKLVPLHVTATGRALLSQMTTAERSAVLRRANFERYTPSTLMSVAAVEKEIQRSLERGWFEGNAEFTLDLGGVALPLKMPHRQFALLLAGPMFRVGERTEELVEAIKGEIKRHLGNPT